MNQFVKVMNLILNPLTNQSQWVIRIYILFFE